MSKINISDLTASNESYLADLEDSSTLESISGGALLAYGRPTSAETAASGLSSAVARLFAK
jgi:hypothetical protein